MTIRQADELMNDGRSIDAYEAVFPHWSKGLHSIPSYMVGGVVRYVLRGVPPGDFLQAVFEDSLSRAFLYADLTNRANLQQWAEFLYSNVPQTCKGSPIAVSEWIKSGGILGQQEQEAEVEPVQ